MRKPTHGLERRVKLDTVSYLLEEPFSPLTMKYTRDINQPIKLSFTNRSYRYLLYKITGDKCPVLADDIRSRNKAIDK